MFGSMSGTVGSRRMRLRSISGTVGSREMRSIKFNATDLTLDTTCL